MNNCFLRQMHCVMFAKPLKQWLILTEVAGLISTTMTQEGTLYKQIQLSVSQHSTVSASRWGSCFTLETALYEISLLFNKLLSQNVKHSEKNGMEQISLTTGQTPPADHVIQSTAPEQRPTGLGMRVICNYLICICWVLIRLAGLLLLLNSQYFIETRADTIFEPCL